MFSSYKNKIYKKKNLKKSETMKVENNELICLEPLESHIEEGNNYSYSWDLVHTIGLDFANIEQNAENFYLLVKCFGYENIYIASKEVQPLSDILKRFSNDDLTHWPTFIIVPDDDDENTIVRFQNDEDKIYIDFNFKNFTLKDSKMAGAVIGYELDTYFSIAYVKLNDFTNLHYDINNTVTNKVKCIISPVDINIYKNDLNNYYKPNSIIQYSGINNISPKKYLLTTINEELFLLEKCKQNVFNITDENIKSFWKGKIYFKDEESEEIKNLPYYITNYESNDNVYLISYIKNNYSNVINAFRNTFPDFEICYYNADPVLVNKSEFDDSLVPVIINDKFIEGLSLNSDNITNSLNNNVYIYFKMGDSDGCIRLRVNSDNILELNDEPLVILDNENNEHLINNISCISNSIYFKDENDNLLFIYDLTNNENDKFSFKLQNGYTCNLLSIYRWRPLFVGCNKDFSRRALDSDYDETFIKKLFNEKSPEYISPIFKGYISKNNIKLNSKVKDPSLVIKLNTILSNFNKYFNKCLFRCEKNGSHRYDLFISKTEEDWKLDYLIRYNGCNYRGYGFPKDFLTIMKNLFVQSDFITILAWDEIKGISLEGANEMTFAFDVKDKAYKFIKGTTLEQIKDLLDDTSYEPENK